MTVPSILSSLSTGSTATKSILSWWKKSRGDARALIGELKDNLTYLDMVSKDDVELAAVIDKISIAEFKRLSREGFDFNKLQRKKITRHPSLAGTDLATWGGKDTAALLESIYEKINDLKIRFPHVKDNKKYRWSVRVQNIRKRIWLLLQHVAG